MTCATQYSFTGTYTLTIDPKGRVTIPADVMRGLEEKVCAVILGDPELRMNQYGVEYRGQWLYVTNENISERKRVKKLLDKIREEDPEAPEIMYKSALLLENGIINPSEEARDIVTRHWRYTVDEKEVKFTTVHLGLDVKIEEIRNKAERKYEPERVMEGIYCSTQRYKIDGHGRIGFGVNNEVIEWDKQEKVIEGGKREIMLFGMQDMLVLITPAQREALQRREPVFTRAGELVRIAR